MEDTRLPIPTAPIPAHLQTWGEVHQVSPGRLVAGERCDLEIEVELARTISAGRSIEVWAHFVSDISDFQCDSASELAFFGCTWPDGRFETFSYGRGSVHGSGSYFPYRAYAGVRLLDDGRPGQKLLIRLCDIRVQTYSDPLFSLRFALKDADDLVGYLGDVCWQVVGGRTRALRVVGPTVVGVGEAFDCHVLARDRYGNPAGDDLDPDALEVETGGLQHEGFTAGEEPFLAVLRDMRLDEEGIAYVTVRDRRTGTEGRSNPVVVRQEVGERIYWGDIHQHAYYLDGRCRPTTSYRYGRLVGRLDFGSVAPHMNGLISPPRVYLEAEDQKGWPELRDATKEADREPDFSALLGYEGTLRSYTGDQNVYLSDFDAVPVEVRLGRGVKSYEEFLREVPEMKGEMLLLPHAHAGGGPDRYDLPRLPEWQTNVEICSVHGVFPEFYHAWLQDGRCVGVHGAGDNHMPAMGNANPGKHYVNTNGLTACRAPRNTRDAIWDAFRERKTYAVTFNKRIYLDFSVNGRCMGSILGDAPSEAHIRLDVAGTEPLHRVELLKNCRVVRTWRPELPCREVLRVLWRDTWNERRCDDSDTRGTIEAVGADISLLRALNLYNFHERISEQDGKIRFQTSAYSQTPRGVLLEADGVGPDAILAFAVRDSRWGEVTLDVTFELPLRERGTVMSRPLNVEISRLRPEFTQEPIVPEFRVEADWLDPDGQMAAKIEWEDECTEGDCYYIRVEQIGGARAWSSAIWIGEQH